MKARRDPWALTLPLFALLIVSVGFCTLGIGIEPNRIDVSVPYGVTEVVQVTVTNPGDDVLQVDTTLVGLHMNQTGKLLWLENNGSDAAGIIYPYANINPYVTVAPKSFTIEPHSEVTILVQVRTPNAYHEGEMAGCVGALWFDVVNSTANSEGSSLFNNVFRLISFVLVQFDGGQLRTAALTPLPTYQDEKMDIHLPVLFSNQGNVHVAPTGQVVIREAETGEIVDVLGLSGGTALPQCPREYQATWRSSSLGQGRFIAETTVTYDTDGPDLTASIPITVDQGRLVEE